MTLMNKEEIEKAAEQWKIIQKKYPEFKKMFILIMEMDKMPSIQEVAKELADIKEVA